MKFQIFKKKCEYCKKQIEKGCEVKKKVKVPEFKGLVFMPFCSKEHAEQYKLEITGTKRTSYCPSCGV
ncbi:MAG: hypothetical protein ACE5ES_01935 [Candidatus Nanoarchaeia archaeon]